MYFDLGYATITAYLNGESYDIPNQKVEHREEGGTITFSGSGTISKRELRINFQAYREDGTRTLGSGIFN